MIVVQTLMDEAAFPWQAVWYRDLGRATCSATNARRPVPALVRRPRDAHRRRADARHGHGRHHARRARRAWSATSACCSRRCATSRPGSSTASPRRPAPTFELVDGQIDVPPTATARRGIQAVVDAHRERRRAGPTSHVGERGHASTRSSRCRRAPARSSPPSGTSTAPASIPLVESDGSTVRADRARAHGHPRVHRAGHVLPGAAGHLPAPGRPRTTRHARIQNLGRVRVVVAYGARQFTGWDDDDVWMDPLRLRSVRGDHGAAAGRLRGDELEVREPRVSGNRRRDRRW